MVLAHHRRQSPLEPAQQIAEPAVAVAVRLDLAVFLPEDHHRHARPLQLARQSRPVRFHPPTLARRDAGPPKEPLFQDFVGDVLRQRPSQSRRQRPFQIFLDGRTRHAQKPPDLPRADAAVVKAQ